MNKSIKFSALVLVAGLTVGCASTSDIEGLQSQIDGLKSGIDKNSTDIASAQSAAAEAAARASAAEAAAERAAGFAEETNSKLDRLFKKSMMK
jgi:murein lipoprotein